MQLKQAKVFRWRNSDRGIIEGFMEKMVCRLDLEGGLRY